jgi:hypothetical protein
MSVQHVAVMGSMQDSFDSIQPDPQTGTGEGLHRCSQVMKQGLDVPPMNIAARRLTKDDPNQVFMFVAHGRDLDEESLDMLASRQGSMNSPTGQTRAECGSQYAPSQGSSLSPFHALH